MLHWWKENKAFKLILDQGREYHRRSSELRIGLPGVVFKQTIQCLTFISTDKNMPSRVLPGNICILFENWTLCHCADSLQSNSFIIHDFFALAMVGRRLHLPGRWLTLPEEALRKFSAQRDREGSQFQDPIRNPGMHRILVES